MRHSIITFISAAAATVALFSCAKEVDLKNQIEPEVKGITVNAIAGYDTKTYVEDGTVPVVKWSSGDKIALIETMDGEVKGSAESGDAYITSDLASFSTTMGWEASGGTSYTYSAVYPSNAFIDSGSKYYLFMPDVQNLNGNNLAPDSDILFSLVEDKGSTRLTDGEDVMFSFRRLGTVVRLELKGIGAGEDICQVVITAPDYIAGAIEYDPITSKVDPTTAFVDAGTNIITLNVSGVTATGDDVLWFRVLTNSDWAVGDAVLFDVYTDKNIYKKNVASLTNAIKFPDGGLTKFGVNLAGTEVAPLSVPYAESFEGSIDDWTFIDSDGDGYIWDFTTAYPNFGSYALYSASYLNNVGVLTPDNMAFTPPIQLTTDNYLSFWVRAALTSYPAEHYEVVIVEDSPFGTNTATLMAETEFPDGTYAELGSDGIYQRYIIKIPDDFKNKVACIGFRHFNCSDQYWLCIDDVEVVEGLPSIGWDAKYEDYLGAWDYNGAKFTVSQKVNGVSYSITGLTNQGSYPVEAVFEAGRLVVYEQLVASSGTTEVFLQGSDGYLPNYPDGSSVALFRAEYDKVNDQLSFAGMTSYVYYMFITYDSQTRTGYLYDDVPSVMVPFVAFNAQYGDYLGDWALNAGKVVISQKVDGVSYSITGLANQGSYPVEAMFEDGRLVLYEQVVESSGTTEVILQGSDGYMPTYPGSTPVALILNGEYDSANDTIDINPASGNIYYMFITYDSGSQSGYVYASIPSALTVYVPDTTTYIYQEDFESDNTADWTFIDADGDNYDWERVSVKSYSGTYVLSSESYINNYGALTPDNWAFTPPVTLTSDNYLSFWIRAQDDNYPNEHYAVYITNTAPDVNDLAGYTVLLAEQVYPYTTVLAPVETAAVDDKYQHFVIPIPSTYDGQAVYIGFRHFNCTDMYRLNIDDVAISEGMPSVTSPSPAPAKPGIVSTATVTAPKKASKAKAPVKPGQMMKERISEMPSRISIDNVRR